MSELLMLAERELVPELFDQAARVPRVGDLVERRRILVPVLLRNHDGLLPQGFVEIGAHVGGDRVRRRPHRIGGGQAVRRIVKPAAKERRLDEPVPDTALLRGVEAGDDREESAEFLNRNRLPPRGRQPIEHDFHRVGVDHEPPAQRGGIANAERDALVAEQEVRSVQAVIGDPRREGALVVDRRAALKAGPVHVDDGDALRLRHFRAAIVEREQLHLAPRAAQALRHGNPEPGLVFGQRRDQDCFGRGGHARAGRFWIAILASGKPVLAHRARSTLKSDGSRLVVDGDPLEQAPDVGRFDALVAPGRTEPGAQPFGQPPIRAAGWPRPWRSARGSDSVACPGARSTARRTAARRSLTPTRTSATRSAARPSLRWK